jgi:hypothetical protein
MTCYDSPGGASDSSLGREPQETACEVVEPRRGDGHERPATIAPPGLSIRDRHYRGLAPPATDQRPSGTKASLTDWCS